MIRKERGVTLIALVVTIIILLILATVSVTQLAGQGGLLNQAKTVTATYSETEQDEAEGVQNLRDELASIKGMRSDSATSKNLVFTASPVDIINNNAWTSQSTTVGVDLINDFKDKGYTLKTSKDGINYTDATTATFDERGAWYIRIYDSDGNQVGSTITQNITRIDKSAPTKNGDGVSWTSTSSSIVLSGTFTENESSLTYQYRIKKNGTWGNYQASNRFTDLAANTAYDVQVVARNSAGLTTTSDVVTARTKEQGSSGGQTDPTPGPGPNYNTNTNPNPGADTTAPVRVGEGIEYKTSGDTITLTGYFYDAESGIAGYQYRLYVDGYWKSQTHNVFSGLTEGATYRAKIVATNGVGLTSETDEKQIKLPKNSGPIQDDPEDNTIEQGNVIDTSNTTTEFNSASITFTINPNGWTNGNVTATAHANKDGYTVQTSKDGNNWYDSDTQDYGLNGTLYARLAKDDKVSVDRASIAIEKIDKVAPTTTATSYENTITINASDELSGISGYLVTSGRNIPDGVSFKAVTNTRNLVQRVSDLSYGTTYYCWTVDQAGNISNPYAIDTESKKGKPVLLSGMSPIKYSGSSWIFCTEDDPAWYNYSAATTEADEKQSHWANAMTTDGSMWVWIPRFEYKITQRTGDNTTAGKIEVRLVEVSQTEADEGFIIHPAFRSDINAGGFGVEQPGIWVAKYKSSNSEAKPLSKPDVGVMRGAYSTARMYTSSYNYNRNYDSHLLKNSEWGAIAYFTHSAFGRNGHEVTQNNSPGTAGAGGVLSSTTGNEYGIYDMATNEHEYVAAGWIGHANIDGTVLQGSTKYIDGYSTVKGKVGDATNGDSPSTQNWFNDYVVQFNNSYPYIMRGYTGIFAFHWYTDAWTYATWRMALSGVRNLQNSNVEFVVTPSGTWTNQNVNVKVINNDSSYTLQVSRDGNNWGVYTQGGLDFVENGTLYARLIDDSGLINNDYASITVTNIDKTKPQVTEVTSYYNTVSFKAKDPATSTTYLPSGIAAYGISKSVDRRPDNWIECTPTAELSATVPDLDYDTKYYVWVKDQAGNIGEASEATSITTDTTKLGKPVLLDGMQPVKYDTSKSQWVMTSEEDDDWYEYTHINSNQRIENKTSHWANARTADGSMWVWIPRFEYKVNEATDVLRFDGTTAAKAGTIDVIFISKDKTTADTGYVINPAFINDKEDNYIHGGWDEEIPGFWIAKYLTSGSMAEPRSIEGQNAMVSSYTENAMYTSAFNYNRALESHQEKTTEYGAVAILTHSKYGRNGFEITPTDTYTSGRGKSSSPEISTTGNVYGAYDYASTWHDSAEYNREAVAAGTKNYAKIDSATAVITGSTKYYTAYDTTILLEGDMTNAETPSVEGWFNNTHGEITLTQELYLKRGYWGMFSYQWQGASGKYSDWRMVLTPNENSNHPVNTERTEVNDLVKPVLMAGMQPVKWDTTKNNWYITSEDDADWYDYSTIGDSTEDNTYSRWANAQTADGSLWVWIPRYEYKINEPTSARTWNLADTAADDTIAGKIDIKFITEDQVVADEGYTIHPVFRDDSKYNFENGGWDSELKGFWAAKYATSNATTANPKQSKSVAGVGVNTAWYVRNSYRNAVGYNPSLNSHMLKNSEWGAIAFLTQSPYGRNRHEMATTTAWSTAKGASDATSTTGNIYGIYDMATNAYEYVAAGVLNKALLDNDTNPITGSTRYYTAYPYATQGKVGDATNAERPTTDGWYKDGTNYTPMDSTSYIYLMRGANGIFQFHWYSDAYANTKWRMALAGSTPSTYLRLTATPTSSTMGPVEVEIESLVDDYTKLEYSLNGSDWSDYEEPVSLTENGSVYAKISIKDKYGVTKSYYSSIKVKNIDKTTPVVNSITSYSNTITFTATDGGDAQGITAYGISTDENTLPRKWETVDNTTSLSMTFTDLDYGREYYVWVKDASGNTSTVSENTHTTTGTIKIGKPILLDGMRAVKYDTSTNKWVSTTEDDDEWYEYKTTSSNDTTAENSESRWANAMTADGSMWIWIPRFEYRVIGPVSGATAGKIDVKFISTDKTTADTGYVINPAFIDDSANNYIHGGWDEEISGFWVAKYRTTNINDPVATPGTGAYISSQSSNQMYVSAYNYNRALESHWQKNTEYGAVVALTHSQYGRNGYEVSTSNSTTNGAGNLGVKTSTTGNVYGAYDYASAQSDANGAYREAVAAGIKGYSKIDSTTDVMNASTKYVNIYNDRKTIEGDFTTAENPSTDNWFADEFNRVDLAADQNLRRGWQGIFSYLWQANGGRWASWRMVLTPNGNSNIPVDTDRTAVNEMVKPVLMDGMDAIKYDTTRNKWVVTSEDDSEWYDYYYETSAVDNVKSKWANAMTADGSFWVWIPRFEYRINQPTSARTYDLAATAADNTKAGTIDIKFIPQDQIVPDAGYTIHPVFRNDSANGFKNGGWDSELKGFWAAKYATSNASTNNTTSPKSVPGVGVNTAWTVANSYNSAINYNVSLNSHMLKNSEWGAIAFLTQSAYGRNAHEVTTTTAWNSAKGGSDLTSTTGNIYGVYDIATNGYEYVAAGTKNLANIASTTTKVTDSTRYYTVYDYAIKGKSGDATNADTPTVETWYNDQANQMTSTSYPYLMRGYYGIFSYHWYSDAYTSTKWRMALAGESANQFIKMQASPTTMTTDSVIVTVTSPLQNYDRIQVSEDGETWNNYDQGYIMDHNGTLYSRITFTDKYTVEKTYYSSIKIENIDKGKPAITSISNYANTITITATDDNAVEQGIVAYGVSTSESHLPRTWYEVSPCTRLSATIPDLARNTEYYVWVKDASGNVNEVSENSHIITDDETKLGVPTLLKGMNPVKYDETSGKWILCDENDPDWYDYSYLDSANSEDNKYSHWANAMTADESMWVWIPRFEYKVNDKGSNAAGTIDVIFIDKSKTVADNDYTINPAFMDDSANNFENGGWDSELSGFWVAKYKSSGSEASPTAKPNVGHMYGGYSEARAYTSSFNYNRNLDSHQLKNSEYGAVAALTHSKYGRNGYEVAVTNSFTNGAGANGTNTSTTGNVYGVYDLATNQNDREMTAAGVKNYSIVDGAAASTQSTKYVTLYSTRVGKKGDFTNAEEPSTEGWFSDSHSEINVGAAQYMCRGINGIFSYEWRAGVESGVYYSWRMVLAGDKSQPTSEESAERTGANAIIQPTLLPGMKAIKYYNNRWNFTTPDDAEWYNYYSESTDSDNKASRWANAMTTDGSYWVWIPRFEYKITAPVGDATVGKIDVKFIPKTQTEPDSGYIIHPVFRNDSANNYANGGWDKELPGFWVAKYKSSSGEATPLSKPGLGAMRGQYSTNRMYVSSYNYNRSLDSHLFKNSEWGAVAYLTHSSYGRNGYTLTTHTAANVNGNEGVLSSTTGNVYGVYDLQTNEYEYVAAGYIGYAKIDSSTAALSGSTKYVNGYTAAELGIGKVGDAGNADTPSTAGWGGAQHYEMSTSSCYLMRGNANIFSYYYYSDAWTYATWRMALAE